MSDSLARLHRSLVTAARDFGAVEADPGMGATLVQDGGGISALDERSAPFASAFRISYPDAQTRLREFTITISETTKR